MSIAFLCLILGFLLGKSTSDRHHLLREQKRVSEELSNRAKSSELDKIENALISTVRTKLSTNFDDFYSNQSTEVNTQLKQNFTLCITNTSSFEIQSQDNLEDFTKQLIREGFNSFIKCANTLRKFLENLET